MSPCSILNLKESPFSIPNSKESPCSIQTAKEKPVQTHTTKSPCSTSLCSIVHFNTRRVSLQTWLMSTPHNIVQFRAPLFSSSLLSKVWKSFSILKPQSSYLKSLKKTKKKKNLKPSKVLQISIQIKSKVSQSSGKGSEKNFSSLSFYLSKISETHVQILPRVQTVCLVKVPCRLSTNACLSKAE